MKPQRTDAQRRTPQRAAARDARSFLTRHRFTAPGMPQRGSPEEADLLERMEADLLAAAERAGVLPGAPRATRARTMLVRILRGAVECGHSVCSQSYIDTGSRECVEVAR